jgi:hypothetical protein
MGALACLGDPEALGLGPWAQETMAAPGGRPGSGLCASLTPGATLGRAKGLVGRGALGRKLPAWPARWWLR